MMIFDGYFRSVAAAADAGIGGGLREARARAPKERAHDFTD